ncbi:hypothetical protein [Kutzneria sp. 744]|uniref:hypothetical protein n=1 Tax=Kutzneria sp. (strain 744) TaxID=345341 RepID=UPI0003EEBA59|nr:hypothetical protein [Kutzneria sp. 744]EWM19712.1 hypothetical protein KUTG_10016 [Kutzneria sp. 744]
MAHQHEPETSEMAPDVDPARELTQDDLDALGVNGMLLQSMLGRNVTWADVPNRGESKGHRVAPVDVTAITAAVPALLPEELTGVSNYEIGYTLWMQAAARAGEGAAWEVTESTFDVSTVPVDADNDDDVCAAVLVDGTWYVIERHADTVRAQLG